MGISRTLVDLYASKVAGDTLDDSDTPFVARMARDLLHAWFELDRLRAVVKRLGEEADSVAQREYRLGYNDGKHNAPYEGG